MHNAICIETEKKFYVMLIFDTTVKAVDGVSQPTSEPKMRWWFVVSQLSVGWLFFFLSLTFFRGYFVNWMEPSIFFNSSGSCFIHSISFIIIFFSSFLLLGLNTSMHLFHPPHINHCFIRYFSIDSLSSSSSSFNIFFLSFFRNFFFGNCFGARYFI